MTTNPELDTFTRHRPRLFAIAYRMLGMRADAEDIVQDAWLRWNATDAQALESAEAWLVTVVTRLSIDRLRSRRKEREAYAGFWLPEPLVAVDDDTPEAAATRADEVSFALLWLLERLSPVERAAFLLRQVFDRDYAEIAGILQKSEAACRQLVHRASLRVRDDEPRFRADADTQRHLLERFILAANSGERAALEALIADTAELVGDGGGKVPSFRHIMRGNTAIANLYQAIARKYAAGVVYRPATVNGAPGLLRYFDGRLESVQACGTDGARITGLYVVRNPDKLAGLPRHLHTLAPGG
ncbi:RNA polymerase sigma-70 factor [Alcaligenaceae bacterium]|nr:RNA polymerase sigma-70 factor [Alcaligenaceae bacterium]